MIATDVKIAPPPAAAAQASSRLVRLEGVGKTFPNGVVALSGVDLEIRRGEFLSLLGPSGCGKSTILRLLSGLASSSAGYINWSEADPELGFVFQEPTLMPWASVFDNVWLPLRLKGVAKSAARGAIQESLAKVGLSGFVALKCELGATVVFVTHSVYESVYLSDRIVVMAPRPGRVVAEIKVPTPLPRDEDFRLGAVYAEACRATSQALRQAMGGRAEDAH